MIRVEADYPGGNIRVIRVEGNTVYVAPDLTGNARWWFYFNFRVHGAGGERLRVVFLDQPHGGPLGELGPCVRLDETPWRWLGHQPVYDCFEMDVPAGVKAVQCSLAVPYTMRDLTTFLQTRQALQIDEIGRSAQGRPLLQIRKSATHKRHRLILLARAHACESMANFVLEGVMDAFLHGDDEAGRYRQEAIDLHVLPMLDVDGVEEGRQGKGREPHDHNRDWTDAPLYVETRLAQDWLRQWVDRSSWVLDVHCPWVRGGRNDTMFFCGKQGDGQIGVDLLSHELAMLSQADATDAIPYDPANNIAFGEDWNIATPGTGSAWITAQCNVRLGTTLEVPYAIASGQAVTPDRLRATGAQLAHAVTRLCQRDQRIDATCR